MELQIPQQSSRVGLIQLHTEAAFVSPSDKVKQWSDLKSCLFSTIKLKFTPQSDINSISGIKNSLRTIKLN